MRAQAAMKRSTHRWQMLGRATAVRAPQTVVRNLRTALLGDLGSPMRSTAGLRNARSVETRWEHVDRQACCLRLPDSKTGAKEVPIGRPAIEVLDAIERTTFPWVIAGRDPGRPLVNLNKAWRRIRKLASLDDVRIHDLRRTAASAGASVGLTLEAVGQILGHSQAATTKRYAFLFQEAKAEAADAMSERVAAGLRGQGSRNILPLQKRA